MLSRLKLLMFMVATLLMNGCALWQPDRIHYTWNAEEDTPCETCSPSTTRSEFIGVALSGGGARASVFAAAAIEVLAEEGLMERTTHISSVSGGGFAAAYYVLNEPKPCKENHQTKDLCFSEDFTALKKQCDTIFSLT